MAIKIGDKFGKLTVREIKSGTQNIRKQFFCDCDCGKSVWKTDKFLKNYKDKTCGCHLLANQTSKICVRCKKDKPKSEYHTSKKACGVQSKCIECMSEYKKKRYWSNRDVELAKYTKSRLKPENIQQRKEYYKKNKHIFDERRKKKMLNPALREKYRKKGRESHQRNKEREKEQKRVYYKRPYVQIKLRLRSRLRNALTAIKANRCKYVSALELLGCDIPFFKEHLESQFKEGMSWEVFSKGLIHIDHIKPCSRFDLTILEEQKKCFHYSNLQPLWWRENVIKGSKYDGD